MIIYDKATTPLIARVHGITGTLRTGKSQAVRNMATVMQMQHIADVLDLQLAQATSEISKLAGKLVIGVPEIYEFEVAGRALSCVHGIVEIKHKFALSYEYRFMVTFRDEVFTTLRAEFGMTERKWKQLIEARLSA